MSHDHHNTVDVSVTINGAQRSATGIRRVFQARPMISAMKHFLSLRYREPAWQTVKPPLSELTGGAKDALIRELREVGFS